MTDQQIVFADHATDFSPATAVNLRPSAGEVVKGQIILAALANAAARQSAKVDCGPGPRKPFLVRAALELAATPTAGGTVDLYWAPSLSATAANGNPGGVSGSDAAYTGDSSNLTAAIAQLEFIGSFVCTEMPTAEGVQRAVVGEFTPSLRYGSLVVVNNSGAAVHTDDVECHIVFDPIKEF